MMPEQYPDNLKTGNSPSCYPSVSVESVHR